MSKSEVESEILGKLVLVLLYMFSWKEKVTTNFFVTRSWKGYSFDVLDSLAEKGYVSSSHGAKSVTITEEGLKRASDLKEKIFAVLTDTYEK
jgi:DNA-binding PadR family transcriptional regulator